jgi:phosphopantetheinyl transferase
MPLFYQQDINASTKLGIWKISENEDFFLEKVPQHRDITHPHKRLQHLAGRFMLQELYPDFPYDLIRIADTRKPFLSNEAYHFSISHCAEYAAAIVSSTQRVGIDVELTTSKMERIAPKFLHPDEQQLLIDTKELLHTRFALHALNKDQWLLHTLFWSAKEAVYKWFGLGGVQFNEQIIIKGIDLNVQGVMQCYFRHDIQLPVTVNYRVFGDLCISWVDNDYTG